MNGAQRAGQDAANTAVASGRGIVVLGYRKRFVEQSREGQVAAATRAFRNGAGIRAAAGQPPRLFQERGVVDVEMVIHEIHFLANLLAGHVIGPAVHVRHQGPHTQFRPQKGRGTNQKISLDLRQEEHKVAAA